MAQSGNWIPNLINWLIGYIILYIWYIILPFANLFMMWQLPLDGITAVYESFAPSDVSDGYTSSMAIGSGGSALSECI